MINEDLINTIQALIEENGCITVAEIEWYLQDRPAVLCPIWGVHPSESVTITAFLGEKGESQLDEKGNAWGMSLILNMYDNIYSPFCPSSLSWIPIRPVALEVILELHASNRTVVEIIQVCLSIRDGGKIYFLSIRPALSIIDKKLHLSIKNRFCPELQNSQ